MNRCKDCHFLDKKQKGATLGSGERRILETKWKCFHDIWSEVNNPDIDVEKELHKSRGNGCYFLKARKGMTKEAGAHLLEYRVTLRRDSREKKMLWATAISCGAAIVATVISLLALLAK